MSSSESRYLGSVRRSAAALLALMLFACSSGSDDDSTATGGANSSAAASSGDLLTYETGPAPSKVSVVVCTGKSALYTPLLVAEGTGELANIEEQFDTEFDLITTISGNQCLVPYTQGDAQILGGALQTDAVLTVQGEPTETIVAPFNGASLFFVGSSEFEAERGTDIEEWDGARVAVVGAATENWVAVLEEEYSITLNKVTLPDFSAFAPALEAGNVDAFIGVLDPAVQALEQGSGFMILNLNTPEAEEIAGAFQPGPLFTVKPDFARDYPEFAQAFVTAIIKALHEVQANIDDPAAIAAMMPDDFEAAKDAETWATSWDLVKPAFASATGGISQHTFDESVKQFVTGGVVPAGEPVPGSVVNNELVLQAYDDLGIERPAGITETLEDAAG